MLALRLNYLFDRQVFCATSQLIAGHPSIKYPIHKHSISHLVKMAQRPYRPLYWVTILHFFLLNAESFSLSRSSRSMETAQRRMPNKSFNADIRYSKIREISLKQEEKERAKQFISVKILVLFHAYVHNVEAY